MFKAFVIKNNDIWDKDNFSNMFEMSIKDSPTIASLKKNLQEDLPDTKIEDLNVLLKGKILTDNINIESLGDNIDLIVIDNSALVSKETETTTNGYQNSVNNLMESLNINNSDNSALVNLFQDLFNSQSNSTNSNFTNLFQNLLQGNSNSFEYTLPENNNDSELNFENESEDDSTEDDVVDDNDSNEDDDVDDNDSANDSSIHDEESITGTENNATSNNNNLSNSQIFQNILNNITNASHQSLTSLRDKYSEQIPQLVSMGFTNESKNIEALEITNGNIEQAVNILLSNL